ncbi:mechanosensitive ion channel family protein [Alteromonas sp. A079]|uniref:mechanosensitive ion channel family protein n=1 Tax=Alteromonas sp. A079 TaxID=3410268 RepID=UPI003B9FE44B
MLLTLLQRFTRSQTSQDADTAGTTAITSLDSAQSLLSTLWEQVTYRLPGIGLGIILMVVFILCAGPLSRFLIKPLTRTTSSVLLRSVLERSISVFIILLGVYVFLYLAGLTGFAIAVVSGTGVVGLILGFAFRDIAENFISSLLLTIQRPFSIGDIVQINSFTGIIQKVTARATTLVDFDGNHIQIPNATIYKGVIKNLTANPLMRGHFIIGVGYDASIRDAQRIALEIIEQHKKVLSDPEPQVLIDTLGASSYNVKVYFWINVEDTSIVKISSMLMRDVIAAFTAAGISMPDDARERIFPQGIEFINSSSSKSTEGEPLEADDKSASKDSDRLGNESDKKCVDDVIAQASSHDDDVSSEAHEIREQARRSRDPESGDNIL